MQTAQIWESIEALNNEAEAALKDSMPAIALIKSSPPPVSVSEQRLKVSTLTVLTSSPTPPTAKLAKKNKNDSILIEPPLPNIKMVEIAAAIERASKMPKTSLVDQDSDRISDDFRQDLLTEVEKAVRVVLAAELPQLVRYAVSVSMYEFLSTAKKTVTDEVKPTAKNSLEKAMRNKLTKKITQQRSSQKKGAKN